MLALVVAVIAAHPSYEPCACQTASVGVVCSDEVYRFELSRVDDPRNALTRRLGDLVKKFPEIHLRVSFAEDEDDARRSALVDHLVRLGVRRNAIDVSDGKVYRAASIPTNLGPSWQVWPAPPAGYAHVTLIGDVGTFDELDAYQRLMKTVTKVMECTVQPAPRRDAEDQSLP